MILAEDDEIVALDIEQGLAAAGVEVAGTFSSCAELTAWLRENTPDLAILDHELRDGSCVEAARTLQARAVPLIFRSLGWKRESWSEFAHQPHLDKPFDLATLLKRATALLRAR